MSVLVLNHNGRDHLRHCLPTLRAQTYPADRFTVEVIDNGSTDGSAEFAREQFPGVRVHALTGNRGFAAAYDEVARASSSEYLAFLNNDTRVAPTWLSELMSAIDRHGAACAGSQILDWEGGRIDFAGGVMTVIGHSWQLHAGEPADRALEDRPLLFACGGSMAISRDAYLDAGGFDRDFFAYFEDVDLGWRLTLLGYKTVFAPRSITYHRLHGTAGKVAYAQRLRLYERNALAMIYKNYEDATLKRVLPVAVALSLLRGLRHSGIDPRAFELHATSSRDAGISARLAAHLLALEDFSRRLPALDRVRADIGRRRRVSDADIAKLFGPDPLRLHEQGEYAEVAHTLFGDFDVAAFLPSVLRKVASSVTRSPSDQMPCDSRTPPEATRSGAKTTGAARAITHGETPFVSVVVLTALGSTHLQGCLLSLRDQSYPELRREVIVVDNASADDPTALVASLYPGARVIRNATNVGFAAGNNVGVHAGRGEYIAFLNDDTRVDTRWLEEMVETATRRQAASVASRILTWDGSAIDFVGGVVNCEGRGFQIDIGVQASGRHSDEHPVLFACGAGMLVKRDVFERAGEWDEETFAYYEDVELGWRFWLLGHEVWFSPRAIVYHKHHGTSDRLPGPALRRLYERNALRILYTHLETDTLARVFPAALLLAADRALLATELSRAARDPDEIRRDERSGLQPRPPFAARVQANVTNALRQRGATKRLSLAANLRQVGARGLAGAIGEGLRASITPAADSARSHYLIEQGVSTAELDSRMEPVPAGAAAALAGLHDFLLSIPALSVRRARLQSTRRRSDRDILGRFNRHWLSPAVSPNQAEHEELQKTLVESLKIGELAQIE